jgi:hypothetical protein
MWDSGTFIRTSNIKQALGRWGGQNCNELLQPWKGKREGKILHWLLVVEIEEVDILNFG